MYMFFSRPDNSDLLPDSPCDVIVIMIVRGDFAEIIERVLRESRTFSDLQRIYLYICITRYVNSMNSIKFWTKFCAVSYPKYGHRRKPETPLRVIRLLSWPCHWIRDMRTGLKKVIRIVTYVFRAFPRAHVISASPEIFVFFFSYYTNASDLAPSAFPNHTGPSETTDFHCFRKTVIFLPISVSIRIIIVFNAIVSIHTHTHTYTHISYNGVICASGETCAHIIVRAAHNSVSHPLNPKSKQ